MPSKAQHALQVLTSIREVDLAPPEQRQDLRLSNLCEALKLRIPLLEHHTRTGCARVFSIMCRPDLRADLERIDEPEIWGAIIEEHYGHRLGELQTTASNATGNGIAKSLPNLAQVVAEHLNQTRNPHSQMRDQRRPHAKPQDATQSR